MTDGAQPIARRTLGRGLGIAVAVLLGALLALAAAGWSFLHSEAGLRWGLSRVPGLTADGVQGSLGSGRITIAQLRWSGSPGTLEVDALALDGLQWRWRPAPGQWLGVQASQGAAARVAWRSAAPDPATPAAPLAAPDSLAWPLAVALPLRITQLQVDTEPELRDLSLQLAVGADGLLVEVHPRPSESHSDADQAISMAELGRLRADARALCALDERTLVTADEALPEDLSAPTRLTA